MYDMLKKFIKKVLSPIYFFYVLLDDILFICIFILKKLLLPICVFCIEKILLLCIFILKTLLQVCRLILNQVADFILIFAYDSLIDNSYPSIVYVIISIHFICSQNLYVLTLWCLSIFAVSMLIDICQYHAPIGRVVLKFLKKNAAPFNVEQVIGDSTFKIFYKNTKYKTTVFKACKAVYSFIVIKWAIVASTTLFLFEMYTFLDGQSPTIAFVWIFPYIIRFNGL